MKTPGCQRDEGPVQRNSCSPNNNCKHIKIHAGKIAVPSGLFCARFGVLRAMKRRAPESDMIQVPVALASGRCETVMLSESATISEVKANIQERLGQCFLGRAAPDGRLLGQTDSVRASGLEIGKPLTAIALQPKVTGTLAALAMCCVGRLDRFWC